MLRRSRFPDDLGDMDEAARLLKNQNVSYVVTCRGLDDPFVSERQWLGTLRANLVAGQPPDFLVPVPLSKSDSLFKVWRVDRAALAAAAGQ